MYSLPYANHCITIVQHINEKMTAAESITLKI